MQHFQGNGKLLLTGEYTVLDGAVALAIPTRFGQSLTVESLEVDQQGWTAYDHNGKAWFKWLADDWFEAPKDEQGRASITRLQQIFAAAESLRPNCMDRLKGKSVTTRLSFNPEWGLGTSSTLIHCLAELFAVDPYGLLAKTFGGSGYDLACAAAKGPLTYQLIDQQPRVSPLDWNPSWLKQTWFVYLNQKQNSREGIRYYRQQQQSKTSIKQISQLTAALIEAQHPAVVQKIIAEHESLTAGLLNLPPVKQQLFPDFPGQIKSLGAWGGDFIWALPTAFSAAACRDYFARKGYQTVLNWTEMIGEAAFV